MTIPTIYAPTATFSDPGQPWDGLTNKVTPLNSAWLPGRGLPAEELNYVANDLSVQAREAWALRPLQTVSVFASPARHNSTQGMPLNCNVACGDALSGPSITLSHGGAALLPKGTPPTDWGSLAAAQPGCPGVVYTLIVSGGVLCIGESSSADPLTQPATTARSAGIGGMTTRAQGYAWLPYCDASGNLTFPIVRISDNRLFNATKANTVYSTTFSVVDTGVTVTSSFGARAYDAFTFANGTFVRTGTNTTWVRPDGSASFTPAAFPTRLSGGVNGVSSGSGHWWCGWNEQVPVAARTSSVCIGRSDTTVNAATWNTYSLSAHFDYVYGAYLTLVGADQNAGSGTVVMVVAGSFLGRVLVRSFRVSGSAPELLATRQIATAPTNATMHQYCYAGRGSDDIPNSPFHVVLAEGTPADTGRTVITLAA